MKFLVISLIALSCAYAADEDVNAQILRSDSKSDADGSFGYSFETGNGISNQAEGHLKQIGKDEVALEISGNNVFTAPTGEKIQLSYVANENGYQPQGDHLPTPPPPQPIPEYIARALEYIAAHPYEEKKL